MTWVREYMIGERRIYTGARHGGKSCLAALNARAILDADPAHAPFNVPAYQFDMLKGAGISTDRMVRRGKRS